MLLRVILKQLHSWSIPSDTFAYLFDAFVAILSCKEELQPVLGFYSTTLSPQAFNLNQLGARVGPSVTSNTTAVASCCFAHLFKMQGHPGPLLHVCVSCLMLFFGSDWSDTEVGKTNRPLRSGSRRQCRRCRHQLLLPVAFGVLGFWGSVMGTPRILS